MPRLVSLVSTGGASAMSTGSAASDAEDDETCRVRTSTSLRSARKIPCYNTDRFSDEELEDDDMEGRNKGDRKLSRAQQQKDARQTQRNAANARERSRMRVLSKAFSRLKTSLPWVPADTKLSKLDTLRLASSYISHLRQLLQDDRFEQSFVHPVNLTWPFMMTSRSEDSQGISPPVRLCGATA
uniref:Transient receptor potential cation channel, subfamily A, member 1b n=1 Tax=Gasterosteus aculeatus aculeatus TaxID=481459 RepID=A0AAQ4PPF5_GASAC